MSAEVQTAISVVQVIASLILIISVLFQSSKEQGISGALSGSAESFFGKSRARSLDSKLAKITSVSAGLFIVLTFVLAVF